MPKRKLGNKSAAMDFLNDTVPTRKSKLRKLDHQDVTISSAAVRLPVKRSYDTRVNMRQPRIENLRLANTPEAINQLVVQVAFLSLDARSPFRAPHAAFPKFSLLPTEIRLIIWKFGRPSPRIIKLSRSTSKIAGCRFQHLTSRIPVPNLLHACYESRSLALRWYTLLFRPRCGYGGTYIDTRQDYMYYGSNQRMLLAGSSSPDFATLRLDEWVKDTRRWAKDRRSMRNVVIHEDKINQGHPFVRLLDLTRWCNESARSILFLGPLSTELEEGAILSDLTASPNTFSSSQFEKLLGMRDFYRELMLHRKDVPGLKNFRPKRICTVESNRTHNVMQNCGFGEKVFENTKLDFSFQAQRVRRPEARNTTLSARSIENFHIEEEA